MTKIQLTTQGNGKPFLAEPLSLPNGEKTTKGEDGVAVRFGMPVVISALTNGWCRVNSIFNAPFGYIPIQDIEVIK